MIAQKRIWNKTLYGVSINSDDQKRMFISREQHAGARFVFKRGIYSWDDGSLRLKVLEVATKESLEIHCLGLPQDEIHLLMSNLKTI